MTSASGRAGWLALLVVLGAGWGLTQPLSKIAVSEGYRHFGLIFWQAAIMVAVLAIINRLRGQGLPLGRGPLGIYLVIALTGTVFPNATSYEAARHLPSGILSIAIATVPLFAFPIAVALRIERFEPARLAGVLCGMVGVGLLIGPTASLPDPAMVAFVPLALVAPLLYGFEASFVSKWGLSGLDPVQVLLGASILSVFLVFPLALASGQFIDPRPPWGAPDLALILSSTIHAVIYSAYVWTVGRAGPTYASLVAYLVTGFGVLWAMALLSERYSGYVWAALGLMFLAMFLVQPRGRAAGGSALAPGGEARQDEPPAEQRTTR